MTVNLRGTVMACKHVIPFMREQRSGAIVNISSVAAVERYPWVAYKASKMGMVAFTKQIAIQNAEYGIRANVILPGMDGHSHGGRHPGSRMEPAARGDRSGARCQDSARRQDGHGVGRRLRRPVTRIRRGPLRHRRRVARRRGHGLPDWIAPGTGTCRASRVRPVLVIHVRSSVEEILPILHVKEGFDSREPFLHVGNVVLECRYPGVQSVESGVHADKSGVHGDESGVHVGGDGP